MTAPTRPTSARIDGPDPDVADHASVETTPDLALPRPSLMDQLHFDRANAADVQRTLGNRIAQRVALEKHAAGETPPNGSAPKTDTDTRTKDRAPPPHADEPTAPRIAPPEGASPPDPTPMPSKGAVVPAPPAPAAMG